MIAALDSSFDRPTPAQAQAAFAAGVRAWGGYLPPGVGLASPWDQASFQVLQRAGIRGIGFASGNDDPAQVAATARAWGVLGCLDDEPAIRSGSGWQQGWLDASGFGHYGLCAALAGSRARFHIVARYPGFDPGVSWDGGCPDPGGLRGWQWQGTHTEFGLSVDRSWLDDGLGGFMSLDPNDPNDSLVIAAARSWLQSALPSSQSLLDVLVHIRDQVDTLEADVRKLAAHLGEGTP